MTAKVEQATKALIAAIEAARGPKPNKRLADLCLQAVAQLNEQIAMTWLTPEYRKRKEASLHTLRIQLDSKYLALKDPADRAINEQCIPLFEAAKTDHEVAAAIRKTEQLKRDRALQRIEAFRRAGPPPPEPVSDFLSGFFGSEPPEQDDPITEEEWDWVVQRAVQTSLNVLGSRSPSPDTIWKDVRKRRQYYERKAEAKARANPEAASAEVKQLKAEMMAAHPDHGGTGEAFRKAHRRYNTARQHAPRHHTQNKGSR